VRLALLGAFVVACGHPTATTPTTTPPAGSAVAVTIDAAPPSQDEQLAAIQKAMNELSPAAQACWAAVAVERFDIEGELGAQIEIGSPTHARLVHDTTKSPKLAACVTNLLEHYPWAPPLAGQSIQLPFKFTAPEGQSVIDRRLVPFAGQGKVSVAVLLDENNSGNGAVSMFEVALAAGGTTGMRSASRAELWYFLGDAEVRAFGPKGKTSVHKGDMIYAPQGSAREVAAVASDVHAVVIVVPGGREGTARAGALPTPEVTSVRSAPAAPFVILNADAKAYDMHRIFVEPATHPYAVLSAAEAELPAGLVIKEHAHVKETEVLYILDGEGTMTLGGVELAIGPTSVVQIPPNTKHAFTAKRTVRALQIYTPAGPEQRFKGKP